MRLLEAHAAPRPAVVNDKVIFGSAVRTGDESRTELTFKDLTITRLGANTIFSFTAGARQAELTQGAILLQVPPKAAPVRANTTAITVSVTGGTALLATGPPTKFMVLEGIGSIYPLGHPEKAVTVHGGEMVMSENGRISNPEKFDVKLVLATSALIVDFAPLANLPLILAVVDQQLAEQQLAGTTTQPLAKNFVDVIDVTDQNATANPVVVEERIGTPSPTVSPPPPPPPTPSKFGTLTVITSPAPYVITSGTTITTDPSITTNGVTDYGKIYRGPTDDGAFSLWAFGSTSAFDTALGIDNFFADPNRFPIAAFKFQSLSLSGNPIIDTSNGGVTKLALIGVNGITSGPPGGTLTFTGLDLLALGTVNGSINLTSDVSFQDLNELVMYARGAGSNLILSSPISNIGTLQLAAEGSIQLTNAGTMSVGEFHATAGDDLTLQIGGSLLLNGKVRLNTLVLPGTTVASGANLTLNVTGDYTNNSATDSSRLRVRNEDAHIGTGGNIAVSIGGDLTAMSDFEVVVHNTNGQIDNGGNITLATGGSISTGGEFSLLVENYNETANPAGHIGTGGNLSLTTGGNLTADFASIAINNRGGGRIDSAVSLTVDIAGAVTTMENGTDFLGNPASLSVALSTRYDDGGGNTSGSFIGGDATLGFHADSASIGGGLSVFLSDRGGTISGNALLNFNITHDVTVTGADIPMIADAADIELLNDGGTNILSPFGGTIHGDATLQVSAANLSVSAGSLDVLVQNNNGGLIDSNATINFNLAGNLTTGHYATFWIANLQNSFSNGSPGGSIGSAATLNINAANISVGNDFFAAIRNQRAGGAPGPGAGSIGTNAMLNIATGSFTVGGVLDVEIDNFNNGSGSGTGGSIGESAAVNFNTDNAVTSGSTAYFQIRNESDISGSAGGFIGGDATVDVSVGDLTSGPNVNSHALVVNIDNRGGSIGGSASIDFGATGSVNAQGNALFQIYNFNDGTSGPGAIGGNATINVSAVNLSTAGFLYDAIGNSSSGSITGSANLNFNLTGDLTSQSYANFVIDNSFGGPIGSDVAISVNAANAHISAANIGMSPALDVSIFNFGGGTIVGSANISLNLTGDLTTQGDPSFAFSVFDIDNSSGGVIGGAAAINVSAANISTASSLFAQIVNLNGGMISGNATIDVTAGNITANSLFAGIDNSSGGTIGGNANINMNVSGTTTVTNDATVAIYGSDGAASAAININGGSYNAGQQFLTYIDGNGTITFNNATAHADVLKAGVFGANGVLNVGGGMLSADTELKLYANGSNGALNFLSNVTLSGSALTKILAANSITIFNNIVVTIGGPIPVDVYTNNANYTGFGGNGTTTGTFAGAGANNPLPLNQAPPFGAPPPSPARRGNITRGTINVSNTADLLALLDGAVVGPDGRITISDSRNTTNLRNLSRINMNGLLRGERRMLINEMRERSNMRAGGRRML